MIPHRTAILLITLSLLAFSTASVAESSSQSGGILYYAPEDIIKFSKKVEKTLGEKGARVAIVARVGRSRDELPKGMNFTHTSFAVYSRITTVDGRQVPGYVLYNMYQDGAEPSRSSLVRDYPVDFFAGVQELEAGVIIPTPELQKRLLTVLASPTYTSLHIPQYSAIANPFTTKLQNCTEFVLDVVVSAIYETSDIKVIKANIKAYFEPQRVNVNPIRLLFGSMFIADVALSDQPDLPVTATFTTLGNFLNKYKAAGEIITITPDEPVVKLSPKPSGAEEHAPD